MALRQIGAFSLALFLFLGSLLAGRLVASNPLPISPLSTPSPTSTPPAASPTATPTPTPTTTPTPLPPTPTIQLRGTVILDDENTTIYRVATGCLTHPLRLVIKGDSAYVVDTGQLKLVRLNPRPSCEAILPPDNRVEGVLLQELGDIALSGDEESLLLLDRAGNLFRYFPDGEEWLVERTADMPGASSRQDLISVCAYDDDAYLLDTNVGQIWRHDDGQAQVIPVEMDLRESADFAVGEDIFVLAEEGYRGPLRLRKVSGLSLKPDSGFAPPEDLTDPSLLFLDRGPEGYLYVTDMGYQRLRVLDPANGDQVREYLFADEGTEVRSAYVQLGKLYLAAKDAIYVYPPEPVSMPAAEPSSTPVVTLSSLAPHDPRVLDLLPPLALPIEGTMLSNLAFRLPGAPRSYRYGVHEGLDFYWSAGEMVTTDTPVLSVADGQVVRVDSDYAPPSAEQLGEMLTYALEVRHTPEDTLDVLRGRQVWIDHGQGVVSRYCHLSAVAEGLEVGQSVKQGQIIGYVGNSGTPASYYGQGLEMHLHLEIRIGDGYLGQYLRPIEVKRWLSQAFGQGT